VRPRDLNGTALKAIRRGKVDRAAIAADLTRAGVDGDDDLVEALVAEAGAHAERRALEDAQRKVVAGLDVPTYELTRLAGGVDRGGLLELATAMTEQGLA